MGGLRLPPLGRTPQTSGGTFANRRFCYARRQAELNQPPRVSSTICEWTAGTVTREVSAGEPRLHQTGEQEAIDDEVEVDLSVVIVSYLMCVVRAVRLQSLFAAVDGPLDTEVIVVDNASGDGSAEMAASEFPEVRLIVSNENLGFARACNLGVDASHGADALLLKPDTIVTAGAPQQLVTFARRNPQVGIAGGRTLADGQVDPSSCWGLPSLWSVGCWAVGLSTVFARSPACSTRSRSAAGSATRRGRSAVN